MDRDWHQFNWCTVVHTVTEKARLAAVNLHVLLILLALPSFSPALSYLICNATLIRDKDKCVLPSDAVVVQVGTFALCAQKRMAKLLRNFVNQRCSNYSLSINNMTTRMYFINALNDGTYHIDYKMVDSGSSSKGFSRIPLSSPRCCNIYVRPDIHFWPSCFLLLTQHSNSIILSLMLII